MGLFMETTVETEDRLSEAREVKDPAKRNLTAYLEEMKRPPNTWCLLWIIHVLQLDVNAAVV